MRESDRKRVAAHTLLALVGFVLSSCADRDSATTAPLVSASSDVAEEVEVATASTPDEFELSPEQLALLSAKGINGDGEAAYRVYLHYSLGWSSQTSSIEQARWLSYAVENGHEQAWLTRAQELLTNRSEPSCSRATYWLRKLLRSNDASMVKRTRDEVDATRKYWSKLSSVPMCDELAKL